MNLRRIIILAYLYVPYGLHKITTTGAFGRRQGAYIDDPIQSDGNSLKSALIKHHVKQFHESSCSVASVVSVVNAIRDERGDTFVPLRQMEILEKVRTANWKERMSKKGHNGKRGLPLPVLSEVVQSSLEAYGIAYEALETVQAQKNSKQSEGIKDVLWQRLNEFEKKGDCLIIAHFDQGVYVPTLNIPHISPVGGFDAQNGDVTILDVDPTQAKPYKLAFDTFYKGLSSNYHHVFRPFGFGSGGYIFIKLR